MSTAELFDENIKNEKFAELIAEKVIQKLDEREANKSE